MPNGFCHEFKYSCYFHYTFDYVKTNLVTEAEWK